MARNKFYNFPGGVIELVPAGSMDGVDQQTGKPTTFTWDNHVRITGRGFKAKLNGAAVQALADLLHNESDFVEWVRQCL